MKLGQGMASRGRPPRDFSNRALAHERSEYPVVPFWVCRTCRRPVVDHPRLYSYNFMTSKPEINADCPYYKYVDGH